MRSKKLTKQQVKIHYRQTKSDRVYLPCHSNYLSHRFPLVYFFFLFTLQISFVLSRAKRMLESVAAGYGKGFQLREEMHVLLPLGFFIAMEAPRSHTFLVKVRNQKQCAALEQEKTSCVLGDMFRSSCTVKNDLR